MIHTQSSPSLYDLLPAEGDRRWVQNMSRNLSFLADMIPADLLVYCPVGPNQFIVVAEAKPSVRESFYRKSQVNQVIEVDDSSAIFQAFHTGKITAGAIGKVVNGQPMSQITYPLKTGRRTCGILVVERNLYEELKHTEEKRLLYRLSIQRAVETILDKSRHIDVPLPSIQPGDALLLVNDKHIIRHASHSAISLARRLGLPEFLEGLRWEEIQSRERKLIRSNGLFEEVELLSPNLAIAVRDIALAPADDNVASMLVLRDITELKQKDRELAIKETIIREVHHRVKNNLQTIAGLLRLQQRRSSNQEVKGILSESIDRIASIAMVHEYLSHEDVGVVDIKELAYNLLSASLQSMVYPDKKIDAKVICPTGSVTLPSAQATSVALILNELLSNTFKHAFKEKKTGRVELELVSAEAQVQLSIKDNGSGLPHSFTPEAHGNLGWQIIHTLVRDDLRGDIDIKSSSKGTVVTVTIPVRERG